MVDAGSNVQCIANCYMTACIICGEAGYILTIGWVCMCGIGTCGAAAVSEIPAEAVELVEIAGIGEIDSVVAEGVGKCGDGY